MNMRDRLARAISGAPFPSKAAYRKADDVLDELMTPTEGMIYSGHDPLEASVGTSNGELYFDAEGPHHTFTAMIKAAKEGK